MKPEPTVSERLAVIEAIALRTEAKLDAHMGVIDNRVSSLERFRAWASGAIAVLTAGISVYVKAHFHG